MEPIQSTEAAAVPPRRTSNPAARVLALQRRMGNRAVGSLLRARGRSGPRTLQRALTATGDAAGFAAFANRVIGAQRVVVSSSGQVSLHAPDDEHPTTKEAAELVSVLERVIGDRRDVAIEFIRGRSSTRPSDASVFGGSFDQSKVDLDDMEAGGTQREVGIGLGVTGGALLVHELLEQYRKQVLKENFGRAHNAALAAEGRAIGAPRGASISGDISATTEEMRTLYTYPDGTVVEVIWDIIDNNISNVRRRVMAPGSGPTPSARP
jgi:hypothetical protein